MRVFTLLKKETVICWLDIQYVDDLLNHIRIAQLRWMCVFIYGVPHKVSRVLQHNVVVINKQNVLHKVCHILDITTWIILSKNCYINL